MLDVMISEELYDEAFATDWTLGFDELAALYKQADRDQAKEWAARWTRDAEKVLDAAPASRFDAARTAREWRTRAAPRWATGGWPSSISPRPAASDSRRRSGTCPGSARSPS